MVDVVRRRAPVRSLPDPVRVAGRVPGQDAEEIADSRAALAAREAARLARLDRGGAPDGSGSRVGEYPRDATASLAYSPRVAPLSPDVCVTHTVEHKPAPARAVGAGRIDATIRHRCDRIPHAPELPATRYAGTPGYSGGIAPYRCTVNDGGKATGRAAKNAARAEDAGFALAAELSAARDAAAWARVACSTARDGRTYQGARNVLRALATAYGLPFDPPRRGESIDLPAAPPVWGEPGDGVNETARARVRAVIACVRDR